MKTLHVAAAMFLVYAASVVANAALVVSWSGDTSEVLRVVVRVIGVAFLARGLWQAKRWAWWLGVLGGSLFFVFGTGGAVMLHMAGTLAERPYPALDYMFFTVCLGALLAAVLFLLHSGSRAAIRAAA